MPKPPLHDHLFYGIVLLVVSAVLLISPIPPQCHRGYDPDNPRSMNTDVMSPVCATFAVYFLWKGWRRRG
jgi:hypothetical protein